MKSEKASLFNECIYAFMVFNKYKITVVDESERKKHKDKGRIQN